MQDGNNHTAVARRQRELYNKHYKRIYNTCFRIVGNSMDAEEAMHDTFMKLFANMNKLDKNSNFYAWSKSIAVNTAIDRVRKKKLYVEPIDHLHVVDEEGVDEEALKFSVDKVKQKLSELPNGYRIVVSMHLFEGFDFEEISSILGVKEVSIRSQFSRGRKKLAELIKNEN